MNKKRPPKEPTHSVGSADLLALAVRSLIAEKDMVNCYAARDIAEHGKWKADYERWHTELSAAIKAGLSDLAEITEANPKPTCAPRRVRRPVQHEND